MNMLNYVRSSVQLRTVGVFSTVLLYVILGSTSLPGETVQNTPTVQTFDELASALESNPPQVVLFDNPETNKQLLNEALAELKSNIASLKSFLKSNGTTGQRWTKFLSLDDLNQQLSSESIDIEKLEPWRLRFRSNQWGLEIQDFRNVRNSLEDYMLLSMILDQEIDPTAGFNEALKSLIVALKQYKSSPAESAEKIDEILVWAKQYRQMPEVCRQVREISSKSNFQVLVSSDFYTRMTRSPMSLDEPVRETIQGTLQQGYTKQTGWLTGVAVPDDKRVHLQMQLELEGGGSNVGHSSGVRIDSNNHVVSTAVKSLYFDQTGVWTSPARANSSVRTSIRNISASSLIAQSIAQNRVADSQPAAQREASYKAARRIESTFNKQTDATIKDANEEYNRIRGVLSHRGVFPEPFNCKTTEKQIVIEGRIESRLAVCPENAPEVTEPVDILVSVHQTAFSEFWGNLIADLKADQKTFNIMSKSLLPESVVKRMEKRIQERKDQLAETTDKNADQTSGESEENAAEGKIYFNAQHPLKVSFKNNIIELIIRIDRFQGASSRQTQDVPMDLIFRYKMNFDKATGTVKMVRAGEMEFVPRDFETGKRRLTKQETTLRARLMPTLKDLLPQSYDINPIRLGSLIPEGVPESLEKDSMIKATVVRIENGWLQIGLTMESTAVTAKAGQEDATGGKNE